MSGKCHIVHPIVLRNTTQQVRDSVCGSVNKKRGVRERHVTLFFLRWELGIFWCGCFNATRYLTTRRDTSNFFVILGLVFLDGKAGSAPTKQKPNTSFFLCYYCVRAFLSEATRFFNKKKKKKKYKQNKQFETPPPHKSNRSDRLSNKKTGGYSGAHPRVSTQYKIITKKGGETARK